MKYYVSLKDVPLKDPNSKQFKTYNMLGEHNGLVSGSSAGITVFMADEYNVAGTHNDQEGFFVLEGSGWGKIGDQEFKVEPDMAYVVPAGVTHCFKKDPGTEGLKVFWFHAQV